MDNSRRPTLMQLQASTPKKIGITAGVMLALILFVYLCRIPNPNMILIAGLVLCSALFGYGGGVVAALVMLGYTLYFFSTDHSFTQFTPQNTQKVAVTMIGVAADMLLVCQLKRAELDAFRQVDRLTAELQRENELLHTISLTDALTQCRNRLGLRRDYDAYQGHEVTVMMLDLDTFKQVNDTHGHDEGDRILIETGRLLSETFGSAHCYRYGGDEFLVIVPDLPEADFREKLRAMMAARPDGVGFSVGCVHAMLRDAERLRELISIADERMYETKRDRSAAEASRSL